MYVVRGVLCGPRWRSYASLLGKQLYRKPTQSLHILYVLQRSQQGGHKNMSSILADQ
jgi:hypothetical protein